MKLKIKSNIKNGALVIGKHHIKKELILSEAEAKQFKTIIENYKKLGWCFAEFVEEIKEEKKEKKVQRRRRKE